MFPADRWLYLCSRCSYVFYIFLQPSFFIFFSLIILCKHHRFVVLNHANLSTRLYATKTCFTSPPTGTPGDKTVPQTGINFLSSYSSISIDSCLQITGLLYSRRSNFWPIAVVAHSLTLGLVRDIDLADKRPLLQHNDTVHATVAWNSYWCHSWKMAIDQFSLSHGLIVRWFSTGVNCFSTAMSYILIPQTKP